MILILLFVCILVSNEIPDNTYNGRVVVAGHLKKEKALPQCELCKQMMKELEKHLNDKKSREQIEQALERVCHAFKTPVRAKCTSFMDKHADQIVDLIMKGMMPKEICTALGFCAFIEPPSQFEEFDMDSFSIDFISIPAGPSPMGRISLLNKQLEEKRTPPKVQANEGCVLCEFVMTKLEADLKDKTTQDEIKKAVENICTKMPKSVRAPCGKFVDNYSELIITLLTTMPPAKICEEIKMCVPPKTQEVVEAVSNDVLECAVCQGAVTIIDRLLEDPNFDRNLEQAVEKTCQVAPRIYKKKCAELVSSYGPSIINMLLANAQPEKVCEEIQLCFPNEYSTFVQINDGELQ